jgi:hypothetical protein
MIGVEIKDPERFKVADLIWESAVLCRTKVSAMECSTKRRLDKSETYQCVVVQLKIAYDRTGEIIEMTG